MIFSNETSMINAKISAGARNSITQLQFFALEIEAWKNSPERQMQILGERYYVGDHDIAYRERTVIGEDGQVHEVTNLPNNRLIDNQYSKIVDQKTNYLLGKPFTLNSTSKGYVALMRDVFTKQFYRQLKYTGEDCLNGGIGWLFLHYDQWQNLCFRRIQPYEILPFWTDDDHTTLECACRLYQQEVWQGLSKTVIERVEIFRADGLYRYILQAGELIPDTELGEHEPYFTVTQAGKTVGYNWQRIPLIPFKYNKKELPLIKRVKSLQDAINTMLSDFENSMQEDARNTILVLENYDGENLGEFRRNLAQYGAVKVRSDEGAKGGVSTLSISVSADNYTKILETLKKALTENARGYNTKNERIGWNASQMVIQSMYSDIDLDANGMETEFQAAFEELFWFISHHFINTGRGDFSGEDISVVFNRDVLINESESIESCVKSVGILSKETVIEQHPWTTDIETELHRLRSEAAAEVEGEA